MKALLIGLGVVLVLAGVAAAVTLVPMLSRLGSQSSYETGQLAGRAFLMVMLLFGGITAIKEGLNHRG